MIIVIVGNVVDGTEAFGPFKTYEEASEWAERHATEDDWHVTEVQSPSGV